MPDKKKAGEPGLGLGGLGSGLGGLGALSLGGSLSGVPWSKSLGLVSGASTLGVEKVMKSHEKSTFFIGIESSLQVVQTCESCNEFTFL